MDDIRKKLALIDADLVSGKKRLAQILDMAPLLPAVVGMAAGIVLQESLGFGHSLGKHPFALTWPMCGLAVCIVAACAVIGLASRRQSQSRVSRRDCSAVLPVSLYSCVVLCFLFLGALRLEDFRTLAPNDISNFIDDGRILSTVRGHVATEPRVASGQQRFARYGWTGDGKVFYLQVNGVETTDGWGTAAGTVRVYVSPPAPAITVGDQILMHCWMERIRPSSNPGQFDTARYFSNRNIFVTASVNSPEAIERIEGRRSGGLAALKHRLATMAGEVLANSQGEIDGLLEALLLGNRRGIDPGLYEAFRKTGLLHFVSLSGLHLGILAGAVWWLCRLAGLDKPGRAAVCAVTVAIFLLIVPTRAPTLRAAIVFWVYCASSFFRRRPSALNSLSLAAIILLLARPTQVFEAGWQLSFASVLGIIFFWRPVERVLLEKTGMENLAAQQRGLLASAAVNTAVWALRLLAVGLAAWLCGAGIIAYHFYTVNPMACLWTVVAFPLVTILLLTGFTQMVVCLAIPSSGVILRVVPESASALLEGLIRLANDILPGEITVGRTGVVPVAMYYALLCFVIFFRPGRPYVKAAVTACWAAAVITVAAVSAIGVAGRLRITCLDVGHGLAVIVRLPDRSTLLFDAGSLSPGDVEKKILAPFLRYNGIGSLDSVAISHFDTDHINAIPDVISEFGADSIFAACDRSSSAGSFMAEYIAAFGMSIKSIDSLEAAHRGYVEVLWPTDEVCRRSDLSDNDKSAVLLVKFGGASVLLCADIEQFSQGQLLELYGDLTADVVLAPHHGSVKTLDHVFLKRLSPGLVISSCGRKQYRQGQVVSIAGDAQMFYTARDGAITVTIDADGGITCTGYLTGKKNQSTN